MFTKTGIYNEYCSALVLKNGVKVKADVWWETVGMDSRESELTMSCHMLLICSWFYSVVSFVNCLQSCMCP